MTIYDYRNDFNSQSQIQFHVSMKNFFKYVAQTHKFKSGNAIMHFPFPLLDVTHISGHRQKRWNCNADFALIMYYSIFVYALFAL